MNMSRTVYVNGEYLAEEDAKISIFDRAFLMADGVYEVTSILDGKICEFSGHVARLHRSLTEMGIATPCSDEELLEIHRELIRRNDLTEGTIYLQVTRGEHDRDFAWPDDLVPGLVLFTQARDLLNSPTAARGLRVVSLDDLRWQRRDIKTVQLLFPSLAKMEAKAQGKDYAWLVEDGHVTEGTSNNTYIVTEDGTIVTRNLSNSLLHGITRASVLKLAAEAQMKVEERPFTIEEAQKAREAFMTSASSFVTPVIEIDGVELNGGKPGTLSQRLREIYIENARATSI